MKIRYILYALGLILAIASKAILNSTGDFTTSIIVATVGAAIVLGTAKLANYVDKEAL